MIKNKKMERNIFWKLCLLLVFSLFIFPANTFAVSRPELNIIIDSSGSMGQKIGTSTKMDIAKKAVNSIISELPAGSMVGLRAYGSESIESKKDCTDTKQFVSVSALNKSAISSALSSISPKGYTLIEYTLKKAYDDFVTPDAERNIVLVSDGIETCGGDPCAAAKELAGKGIKLTINTVGFAVDAKTKAQLKCIADATGGVYADAGNEKELIASLRTATQKVKNFVDYTTVGQEITGGSGFENAPTIQTNKSYIVDILPNETQFVKVSIPINEKFQLLSTSVKDINYKPGGACSTYLTVKVAGINYEDLGQITHILIQGSSASSSAEKPLWLVDDYLNSGNTDLFLKMEYKDYSGCPSALAHATFKVVTKASTTVTPTGTSTNPTNPTGTTNPYSTGTGSSGVNTGDTGQVPTTDNQPGTDTTQSGTDSSSNPDSQTAPANKNISKYLIFGGIALAVIIAVFFGAYFVLKNKKNKLTIQPAQTSLPPQAPQALLPQQPPAPIIMPQTSQGAPQSPLPQQPQAPIITPQTPQQPQAPIINPQVPPPPPAQNS